MLASPLYMLQIYDRVLSSRSVPTLVVLSVFLVGAYAFQGALDLIRSRVVIRVTALLDRRLALTVHDVVIRLAVATRHPEEGPQPVRDLDQIRAFLTSCSPESGTERSSMSTRYFPPGSGRRGGWRLQQGHERIDLRHLARVG
jgi:hypothetical protein